jgi:hypothetical protein
MMEIGRKIYFDKVTGNALQDCGERQGNVIETTQEQDFASYVSLSERVPSTVGVIQLAFGQYADKFGVNYYSINTVTNAIVWGALIVPDAPIPQPTNQEVIDNQLILMDVLGTMFEAMLVKGTV